MKKNIYSLAFATIAVSSPLLADRHSAMTEYDFAKINANIKAAIQPVLAASDRYTQFTYEFDGSGTDVKNDRYAVKMSLDGKAPWSTEGFNTIGSFAFDHSTTSRDGVTKITSKLETSTDTLAMIRHFATKSTACAQLKNASGVMRLALTEKCKFQPKLAKVQTLDDLQKVLQEHQASAKVLVAGYRADLVRARAVVVNDESKQCLDLQLKEAENLVKSVNGSKLMRTDDSVQMSVSDMNIMGLATLKNADVEIEANKIRMKFDGAVTFGSLFYTAAKPELVQILHDLEEGQDYTRPLIQMETRFLLRLVESVQSGESM